MNKPMQSAKQEALAAISALPEETSFDEIVYRLHVIQRIREGLEDIDAGRTVSHEDVKAELMDRLRFRALLLEGRDSGPGVEVDEAFFEDLRARIRKPDGT